MSVRSHDALVREYLRRLGWGLHGMDPNDRDQLMSEITDHIARARAELPSPTEEDVRAVLERLGPPEAIVAEAAEQHELGAQRRNGNGKSRQPESAKEATLRALVDGVESEWGDEPPGQPGAVDPPAPRDAGERERRRRPARAPAGVEPEMRAVSLLLAGGLLLVVGWFVGVVLLWRSEVFTLQDKLLGTLVLPGGLLPAVYVLARPLGGAGWPVRLVEFVLCVLLAVATSIYLHRRLRARQVATGFESFRARRAAHAAERARNEMGLG